MENAIIEDEYIKSGLANGTIKICPFCGVPGELASGCNYIKCPRTECLQEWCWICRNPKFKPAAGLPACNDPTHNSHSN